MRSFRLILLVFLLCPGISGFAQKHDHNYMPGTSKGKVLPIQLIENKGQWDNKAKFAADLPSGKIFCEQDRLTYVFYDLENFHEAYFHQGGRDPKNSYTIQGHAFQLVFRGATYNSNISPKQKHHTYYNYFLGNDPAKWVGGAQAYLELQYQSVYPGIDFILYAKEAELKYDLIVQPNIDPAQIQLEYIDVKNLKLRNGELYINTTVNTLVEQKPYAYQKINGKEVQVPCKFTLKNNTVGFEFPEGYNENFTLVIDPTIIFSTYTGSNANNFGYTATYDGDGNLYGGGIAFGQGYPITTGAFQTTFGGGGAGGAFGPTDIAITKYSTTGTVLYATFLGGSNNEQPHSMVCNTDGDLLIFGRTYSNNFPMSSQAYDPTYNGDADIVIAKLSANGTTLLGATYLGGSGEDAVNVDFAMQRNSLKANYGDDARGEIITDINDNVYIASCTRSTNFPTTPGVFQPTPRLRQEACVAKLSSNLDALTWSTYLGGGGNDAAYSLQLDGVNNVYVAGGTESSTFPTTSNAWQNGYQGGIDGFVAHLSNDGSTLLQSTFVGTGSYDQTYFVQRDKYGAVYVFGQTEGAFPVVGSVWSTPVGGLFIAKFDSALSTVQLSTRIGNGTSTPPISPTAFLVDKCGRIFISGWGGVTNVPFIGGTTTGLPTTANAFQSTTDGSDLYLAVFEKDLQNLEYATFIGGSISNEHVDGGTSRFSPEAVIYQAVCAGCFGNSDFPMVNAASAQNNSSCNLACFKMELAIPSVEAVFTPDPYIIPCAPGTVNFTNQSTNGTSFFWDFDDNGATSTQTNPSHTYTQPGTYRVRLIAFDPNTCNPTDTTYRTVIVRPDLVASVTPGGVICQGESITITASGGTTYQWIPTGGLSSSTSATVTASPTVTTIYAVIVSDSFGCDDTVTVAVGVLASPTATAGSGGYICPDSSFQLNAATVSGYTYSWSPSNSLDDPNIHNPLATPYATTNYILTVTAPNGCTDTDTVQVEVSPYRADAGPNIDLCLGDTTIITPSGGGIYSWSPVTYSTALGQGRIEVYPPDTITYYLTVNGPDGCVSNDSVTVFTHLLPTANAGPDTSVCIGDAVQLNASGASFFSWTPPQTLSNPAIANPFASPSANTTYQVVVSDIYGCSDSDEVFVKVLPRPVADAGTGGTICQDSSIQLQASGGITYSWAPAASLDNSTIANPVAVPAVTTDYVVTVWAGNGCTDTDTVQVQVTPTPVADAGSDQLICLGSSIRLWGSGGESYIWSTGDSDRVIRVSPDTTELYTLVIFANGCFSKPDTVQVEVNRQLPVADFIATPDSGFIPLDVQFQNTSQGATQSYWIFGDGNYSSATSPSHLFTDTGRYETTLIATNSEGCSDTARKWIIVVGDFVLFIPNAFSPNGDGVNDGFITPNIGVKDFHIRIYDRWGMMIYESFDPKFEWDGWFQEQPCQEGAYTFVIEGNSYFGYEFRKAGTVTLLF